MHISENIQIPPTFFLPALRRGKKQNPCHSPFRTRFFTCLPDRTRSGESSASAAETTYGFSLRPPTDGPDPGRPRRRSDRSAPSGRVIRTSRPTLGNSRQPENPDSPKRPVFPEDTDLTVPPEPDRNYRNRISSQAASPEEGITEGVWLFELSTIERRHTQSVTYSTNSPIVAFPPVSFSFFSRK